MKAPPHFCALCQRRIGRDRTHFIPIAAPPCVVCGTCFSDPRTHAELWPDCPAAWHDPADHGTHAATRAAAHQILARRYCMAGIGSRPRTWTHSSQDGTPERSG